jgi:hypothetical protein
VRPDWQQLTPAPPRAVAPAPLHAVLAAVAGSRFGLVVVGVVVLGLLVAVVCGLTGRDVYDRIGRGGLGTDGRSPGPAPTAGGPPEDRDEEIRQMLGARHDLLARRARDDDATAAPATPAPDQPPTRTDPPVPADPGLADELRQLAVARNVRRLRQGLDPLDVDAEVARRLREL